jgi:hypothetical protein
MGQGYYFGRPVAAELAAQRIVQWTNYSFEQQLAAPR